MKMFRLCTKCNTEKLLEGGVETRPGHWLCAKCWPNFFKKK